MRNKGFALTTFLLPFLIGCSFNNTFNPPKYYGSQTSSSSDLLTNGDSSASSKNELSSSSDIESFNSEAPLTSQDSSSSTISHSFSSSSSSEYKFDFNYEWPEQFDGENPLEVPVRFEKDFRIRFEGARSFEDSFECKTLVFDKVSAKYYAKTYKTLYRDQPYTYFEDVAMYYMAFNTWPENYKTSKSQAIAYGVEGRCVSTYTYGSYSGSNNYTNSFGKWNNDEDGVYYELDIDVTSDASYNTGSSITRGTGRLVVVKEGLNEDGYGAEPVVFYTTNHYSSFYEFYNYYGGWGEEFNGARYTNTRPNPKTISNWVEL